MSSPDPTCGLVAALNPQCKHHVGARGVLVQGCAPYSPLLHRIRQESIHLPGEPSNAALLLGREDWV